MHYLWAFLVLLCCIFEISGSPGDRDPEHRLCVNSCMRSLCKAWSPSWTDLVTGWQCTDECAYECMWRTVKIFERRGRPTPQFKGKWPFVRLLGLQEPAAAIFSALNLLAHLYLVNKLWERVPATAPMRSVWTVYGIVSVNAWVCSTIFHARDVDTTEKLDYFSAFSVMAYSLLAFMLRILRARRARLLAGLACSLLFIRHVYSMWYVNFDYGYNMKMSVGVGLVNSICWLAWCGLHWRDRPYVKKGALAVVLLDLSVLLELLDFVPVLWSVDAHALWHLSTVPIHFVWYRFVIDDCEFLLREGDEMRKLI